MIVVVDNPCLTDEEGIGLMMRVELVILEHLLLLLLNSLSIHMEASSVVSASSRDPH